MALKYGFEAEDIIKAKRIDQKEIDDFKDILSKTDLPVLTDEQIVLFILSCDHDLDFTLTTVREYYNSRKNGPELFNGRCLEKEELQYQLNVILYSIFPTRTDDGCAVLYHALEDTCYSHYQIEHSMRLLFMTLDAAVYDNPPTGLVILFDMKGVGLLHLTKVKINAVRTFCHYVQDGLPVKLREIHVLNTNYLIDKVMFILKPFMKKELLALLHFHPPNLDMTSFNELYVPKKCLPSNYGGDLPSTSVLHQENTKKLMEMRPYFDAEEKQRRQYYAKK